MIDRLPFFKKNQFRIFSAKKKKDDAHFPCVFFSVIPFFLSYFCIIDMCPQNFQQLVSSLIITIRVDLFLLFFDEGTSLTKIQTWRRRSTRQIHCYIRLNGIGLYGKSLAMLIIRGARHSIRSYLATLAFSVFPICVIGRYLKGTIY